MATEDAEALRRIPLSDPTPNGDYAEAMQAMSGEPVIAQEIMTPDLYFQQFCCLFDGAYYATSILPDSTCPTLESLKISDQEVAQARAASDALYKLAEKYPGVLGWTMTPVAPGLQACAPIAVFLFLKWQMIKAEIKQKAPAFLAKKAGSSMKKRFFGGKAA